jgi:hypothetical protein
VAGAEVGADGLLAAEAAVVRVAEALAVVAVACSGRAPCAVDAITNCNDYKQAL